MSRFVDGRSESAVGHQKKDVRVPDGDFKPSPWVVVVKERPPRASFVVTDDFQEHFGLFGEPGHGVVGGDALIICRGVLEESGGVRKEFDQGLVSVDINVVSHVSTCFGAVCFVLASLFFLIFENDLFGVFVVFIILGGQVERVPGVSFSEVGTVTD